MLLSKVRHELEEHGWCTFRDTVLASDILSTASLLGEPVSHPGLPLVGILKPVDKRVARPNSMSSLFGKGAFPLHTDMAHWPLPPRYMVMRASVPAPGFPTVMIDSLSLKWPPSTSEDCRRAAWLVTGIHNPYLCSIYFEHRNVCGFRWDPCIMAPHGPLAESLAPVVAGALQDLLASAPIPMDWTSEDAILVIDNWRMVHMRPKIDDFATSRTLERVLVKESRFG